MPAAVQRLIRSTHIISIPLTRPRPFPSSSPNKSLSSTDNTGTLIGHTFYQYQIHKAAPIQQTQTASANNASQKRRWGIPEGGIVKWAQSKATNTWIEWGKAPENSWKFKVFKAGERINDRIDFEELALQTIDPALGPKIPLVSTVKAKSSVKMEPQESISLLYPSSLQTSKSSLSALRLMVSYRTPKHRKGFWTWLIISPFTAPFMIIPVIPNLPFFFCIWRSWSHYRAFRASQYLTTLIDNGYIIPTPSLALDTIYENQQASIPPSSSSTESESGMAKSDSSTLSDLEELLSPEAIPLIVKEFDLAPSAAADLRRAMEQCRSRIQSDNK